MHDFVSFLRVSLIEISRRGIGFEVTLSLSAIIDISITTLKALPFANPVGPDEQTIIAVSFSPSTVTGLRQF